MLFKETDLGWLEIFQSIPGIVHMQLRFAVSGSNCIFSDSSVSNFKMHICLFFSTFHDFVFVVLNLALPRVVQYVLLVTRLGLYEVF